MRCNPIVEGSLVRLYRQTYRSRDYFSRELSHRIMNICLMRGIPILKKHAEQGLITTTTWFPFPRALDGLGMIIDYAHSIDGHADLARALRHMQFAMENAYLQSMYESRVFYKRIIENPLRKRSESG